MASETYNIFSKESFDLEYFKSENTGYLEDTVQQKIKFGYTVPCNGTMKKTIVIGPGDDILITFDYNYKKINDVDVKDVYDFYLSKRHTNNLIIDNRMNLSIAYLSMYVDDLLIYDCRDNTVLTFYRYANKKLFNKEEKLFDHEEIISLVYMYTFIKYFCKKLTLIWLVDKAIDCIKNSSKLISANCFNVECMINYLQETNVGLINKTKFKKSNIATEIKIKNNMSHFKNLESKDDLIMELISICDNSKFVALSFSI